MDTILPEIGIPGCLQRGSPAKNIEAIRNMRKLTTDLPQTLFLKSEVKTIRWFCQKIMQQHE